MPYFDRIRQLAAAHGAPGRPRAWGLEVEAFRPAAATPPAAATTMRTTPPGSAAPSVHSPRRARDQRAAPAAPPRGSPAPVVTPLPNPVTARPAVRAAAHADPPPRTDAPQVSREPAPASPDARADARPPPDVRADAPPPHTAPLRPLEVVTEAARVAPPEDVAGVVSAQPPQTAPMPETAAAPATRVTESHDTAERAHRALVEVRRWMEEPPGRREAHRQRPRPAASAAATEPPLSIGTIEVTVEAMPAPRPPPAVAPPPPPTRRAGRDVVPRDYLRGW